MHLRVLLHQGGCCARLALAAAFAVLAALTSSVEASNRSCRQIEAQLAALPASGRTSSAQSKRYDAAIQRQQQQMQKARDQGRQAGCGRAMSGRAVAFCAGLNATLDKMQSNLADLQRQRARAGGTDTRRKRARLQAALQDCLAPDRLDAEAGASPNHIAIDGQGTLRIGGLRGNFRTMCVRTCDGYYFPVSNSVPASGFARDQAACQSLCPGTDVELHYHRMQGQEADDMVSAVTGQPYRQMKNAFVYRKPNASVPEACSCTTSTANPQSRGFAVIGGEYAPPAAGTDASAGTDVEADAIPQPSARPDPAEDPETLMSREGGLDAEALRQLAVSPALEPNAGDRPAPGNRPVRVVGPRFLPDPAEATDLQVRDPAAAR